MSILKEYKPQPRDNEYYEGLLKRRAPRIYKEWQRKKFANLRQALIAAKIKRETTARDLLFRGWSKATAPEKQAFREFIIREELADIVDRGDFDPTLLDDLDVT